MVIYYKKFIPFLFATTVTGFIACSYGSDVQSPFSETPEKLSLPGHMKEKVKFDAEKIKNLLMQWLEPDLQKQRKALFQLSLDADHGMLKDIPHKYDVFESLIKTSENILFLKDSICFLARMPRDAKIVELSRKLLKSDDTNKLIASLAYLKKYDEKAFNGYWENKNYENIKPGIKNLFIDSKAVIGIRDIYLEKKIDKLLTPRVSPDEISDSDDPVYNFLLLNDSVFIPGYINRHQAKYMDPALPLPLVFLLGQIASSESFELLLDNYIELPNYRNAISLAACTGSLQVDILFKRLSGEKLIDKYLIIILGKDWDKIKGKDLNCKKHYYLKNYQEIRQEILKKTKPVLG